MDNNQEEDLNTYSIPLNYKQAGTWKNLRIPNLIEGVILAVIADSFIIKMPFTFQFKILVLIILSGGILIFAIHGINGERISLFLLVTLKYLLKRLSRKTKYHMRKVGIYDVQTPKNRTTSIGTTNIFSKVENKVKSKYKKEEKE